MKKLFVILSMVTLLVSCGGSEEGATDSPENIQQTAISGGTPENLDERSQTIGGINSSTTNMLYTPGGEFFLCGFMDAYQAHETTALLKDADNNQLLIFTYEPNGTYSTDDYRCTNKFYIDQGYFYFDIISNGTWVLSVAGNSWTESQLNGDGDPESSDLI